MKVILAAIFSLLLASTANAAECSAEVFPLSTEDDGVYHVTEFEIVVQDCSDSTGSFNYTLVITAVDGSEQRLLKAGGWPRSETKPTTVTEERDASNSADVNAKVESVEVTSCSCYVD